METLQKIALYTAVHDLIDGVCELKERVEYYQSLDPEDSAGRKAKNAVHSVYLVTIAVTLHDVVMRSYHAPEQIKELVEDISKLHTYSQIGELAPFQVWGTVEKLPTLHKVCQNYMSCADGVPY